MDSSFFRLFRTDPFISQVENTGVSIKYSEPNMEMEKHGQLIDTLDANWDLGIAKVGWKFLFEIT